MTSYLDKLNLRPQEKRLVVFVGVVVFVVVNLIWVVPELPNPLTGRLGKVRIWNDRRKASEETLQRYTGEIGRIRAYSNELVTLQSENVTIGNEDATLSLARDVSSLAMSSSVQIDLNNPVQRTPRTNSLFEEAGLRITVTALESNLVEFLYNLGARGTLIRVRTMSLSPDPSQTRLKANLEFVQSFLKRTIKPGTPLATAAKAAAKASAGTAPRTTAPAAQATNAAAVKTAAAASKPPPSTNTSWIKSLLARITGGSSASKPAPTTATNKSLRPAPGKTTFTPNTNKPPANPASPAQK